MDTPNTHNPSDTFDPGGKDKAAPTNTFHHIVKCRYASQYHSLLHFSKTCLSIFLSSSICVPSVEALASVCGFTWFEKRVHNLAPDDDWGLDRGLAKAVEKLTNVRWNDKTIKALRELEDCGLILHASRDSATKPVCPPL